MRYVSSAKALAGANVTSPASELVSIVRLDASACRVVGVRAVFDVVKAAAGAAVARIKAAMIDFIVVDRFGILRALGVRRLKSCE